MCYNIYAMKMIILKCFIVMSAVIASKEMGAKEDNFSWIHDHVSTPIEYTQQGEVAIIYNTEVNFEDFMKVLKRQP